MKAEFRFLLLWVSALGLLILGSCSRSSERDVLIIGMDATYPPFEFKDAAGNLSGVSVAIGNEIGKTLGKPVVFENMSFEGLPSALNVGHIDLIISSLSATDERRKTMDFSDPYVKNGLAILAAKNSTIQSAADLKTAGRKVVVRIATTGEQWSRSELPEAELVALDSDAACVLEVLSGRVDAWVYDQISVMNYHEKHPDTTRALLTPLRVEYWAVGVRKGRDDLRLKVNETLSRMKQEKMFEQLADEYLSRERSLMKAQGLPFVF